MLAALPLLICCVCVIAFFRSAHACVPDLCAHAPQGGHIDVADRLFLSIPEAWQLCTSALSEVKELTPEFFTNPYFLRNLNGFKFGFTQDNVPVVRMCCC